MKRNIIIGAIFIVGLGIFLYPIIAHMFSTTVHKSTISDYRNIVDDLTDEELEQAKRQVADHNGQLKGTDLNFVDPFNASDDKKSNSEGNKSYYDALNIGPSIGSVNIPKIDIELPIYHGTSDKVLSRGAGHLENSSLPSSEMGVHSVITAHRGLPSTKMFRELDKLQVGDVFEVEVLDEKLYYEVNDIKIVKPHETSWLQIDDDKNEVTLLTCDPYMINTDRLLVTGHIIPAPPVEAIDIKVAHDWVTIAVILTVVVAITTGIYKLIKHKEIVKV